jgi:hypothetical protein
MLDTKILNVNKNLNKILLFILIYTDHNSCILKLRSIYIITKKFQWGGIISEMYKHFIPPPPTDMTKLRHWSLISTTDNACAGDNYGDSYADREKRSVAIAF